MSLPLWLQNYVDPSRASGWGAEGWLWCRRLERFDEEKGQWASRPAGDLAPMLVVRVLNKGGMGVTLLVITPWDGDVCVCKVALPGESPDRFEQETQLLSQISHRQIVAYRGRITFEFPVRRLTPMPAYLMEFVSGGSLSDRLRVRLPDGSESRRRLPLYEALRVFDEIIDGVDALHQRGVAHRDLKPANVLFDVTHGRSAKLCDLGLAKDKTRVPGVPGSVGVLGTAGYNAPETVIDRTAADHRVDYFAAGCILAEMLSGVRTFRESPLATTTDRPSGLDEIKTKYGDGVRNLLLGLLQRDPAVRLTDPTKIRSVTTVLLKDPGSMSHSWAADWPQLDSATETELRGFLAGDGKPFHYGRQVEILFALHAERATLIEFGVALDNVQSRIWRTLMELLYEQSVGLGPDTDGSAFLRQKLLEFEINCNELLEMVDKRIPQSLQDRLEFVSADRRLVRAFQVLRRRGETASQRQVHLPILPIEETRRMIKTYGRAIVRIWRSWLHLQVQVAQRINECSDQLMVALATNQ